MAEGETFDTESFIEEIRNLPSIWDYTSALYSNRIERAKAWETICIKFCENFDGKEKKEKNECAVKIQRKWRTLRDCYNRELKANNTQKSGSEASKRRKYMYFDNLNFLKPIAERRITESSINDPTQNEEEEEQQQQEQQSQNNSREKRTQKKTMKTANQETDLINKLSSRLSDRIQESKEAHTDSDMHFLMSLHDRFKAIDNRMKMDAQIDILNVIKKYSFPQPVHTYNRDGGYDGYYGYGYNTATYGERQQLFPENRYGHRTDRSEIRGLETRAPRVQPEISPGSSVHHPTAPPNEAEFSPQNNPRQVLSPSQSAFSPESQDSLLSQIFN